uniref:Erwinia carotovora plasmid pEC3 DNA n=1 Tax=Pectobacterium carotovorum TaxID=554 RepID=Q47388_PECCA|nr:unnamed protein product [Pectobacterium carotovorum]
MSLNSAGSMSIHSSFKKSGDRHISGTIRDALWSCRGAVFPYVPDDGGATFIEVANGPDFLWLDSQCIRN